MAVRTLTSKNRKNRLIISTICTHLPMFHEAGFEYRTERKRTITPILWDPSTWAGYRWEKSDSAAQPAINDFHFLQIDYQERNPVDFGVQDVNSVGYFKSSCISVGDSRANLGHDPQIITDVVVTFTYNGARRTLRHSYA